VVHVSHDLACEVAHWELGRNCVVVANRLFCPAVQKRLAVLEIRETEQSESVKLAVGGDHVLLVWLAGSLSKRVVKDLPAQIGKT
jgi:hypothetical protein